MEGWGLLRESGARRTDFTRCWDRTVGWMVAGGPGPCPGGTGWRTCPLKETALSKHTKLLPCKLLPESAPLQQRVKSPSCKAAAVCTPLLHSALPRRLVGKAGVSRTGGGSTLTPSLNQAPGPRSRVRVQESTAASPRSTSVSARPWEKWPAGPGGAQRGGLLGAQGSPRPASRCTLGATCPASKADHPIFSAGLRLVQGVWGPREMKGPRHPRMSR